MLNFMLLDYADSIIRRNILIHDGEHRDQKAHHGVASDSCRSRSDSERPGGSPNASILENCVVDG